MYTSNNGGRGNLILKAFLRKFDLNKRLNVYDIKGITKVTVFGELVG